MPFRPTAVTTRCRPRLPVPSALDQGMSTAEYAIGTATACAFAAALYLILTSSQVRETLTRIVTDALQTVG
ncbi:DUF4244 domain-containing protein [Halostreptopolyspora alba]